MPTLTFNNLEFEETTTKINVRFMHLFEFSIPKKNLGKSIIKVSKNSIETDDEKEFNKLLTRNIANLRNLLTKRKTTYIHKNSNIPLLGTLYFGIVDKGTDMIEVKPITGCNIECVFCSVGEGLSSKKESDYVVEDDYIAEELEKLLKIKKKPMKIFINPHGEPLLYSNIVPLVEKISKLDKVDKISIITNGVMLNEEMIDDLVDAGLTGLNISINSFDPSKARVLAGISSYNTIKVKKIAEYAAEKLSLTIAPVRVRGLNDEDVEKIIGFAKKINCKVGIQKFIEHKRGKKPIKEASWESFYKKIEEWEKKFGVKLRHEEELVKTKELPMPFKRESVIKAVIVCKGRKKGEVIAAAKERCILVYNCNKNPGAMIKIKIISAKHNIFTGEKI